MTRFTETDRRILAYLLDQASQGRQYFRAKHIASHLGLSSKQVGARLPRLARETDQLDIRKWGRHRSTTWHVQPR